VFSGMLGVTLFGLVLTPVFYYLVRRLRRRAAALAAPSALDAVTQHSH
jgi:multidrug efflux pump